MSKQRSDAIINYLLDKGIEEFRLIGKGYGETQIVNHCENGVRCTSEQHQQNRRIEYMIIEIIR